MRGEIKMIKYINMLLRVCKEDKKKELIKELENTDFGIIENVYLSVYNHGREEMEFYLTLDEREKPIYLLEILFSHYEEKGGCWQLAIETEDTFSWIEVNELTIEWDLYGVEA